jgi:hypothetical protein
MKAIAVIPFIKMNVGLFFLANATYLVTLRRFRSTLGKLLTNPPMLDTVKIG